MIKKNKYTSTFVKGIVLPSLLFILGVSILSILIPNQIAYYLNTIKEFLFHQLNWMYVLVVSAFVFFLIFLVFSKYGSIKLGPNDAKPEFSFFSWVCMLFAAGMGIGLMYFSVAEPISHFSDPSLTDLSSVGRAKNAQLYTFFHWGIHAWAIYGVVGLSLAYFAYRYKLPLSLRSCFYPVFKDKIQGTAGDIVDMFALCSTFFGITTTLGFGVMQLSAGLKNVGLLDQVTFVHQIIIVAVIMGISILSAVSGVSKGVKFLSQLNIVAAVLLMLFVLVFGPTTFLLGTFSEGLGDYINNFFSLSFNTYAYETERQEWFYNWTILYWAWWISWAPYVGLFIAKISRGRSIREFICAVLLLPTLFNFLWMTIFGNSAMWLDIHEAQGALSSLRTEADTFLFRFFEYFPMGHSVSIVALLIIFIFFVTSADSGIYVMNNISSKNAANAPKWQLVFWGALLGFLALVLLNVGGLQTLQTMTLITALPFAVIMVIFCYSLIKGLYIDTRYYETPLSHATNSWSGVYWKERLDRILSYNGRKGINDFLEETVKPALQELQIAFGEKGIVALFEMHNEGQMHRMQLTIKHDNLDDFVYGISNKAKIVSDSLINEDNAPEIKDDKNYIPFTYFGDTRPGYDVQYFTKVEMIADVLKQYERFIALSSEKSNEIFIGNLLRD